MGDDDTSVAKKGLAVSGDLEAIAKVLTEVTAQKEDGEHRL